MLSQQPTPENGGHGYGWCLAAYNRRVFGDALPARLRLRLRA